MDQVRKWEESRGDGRTESVREILREERLVSKILVRNIYREQIEDGVRSKIARLMRRSRDPWYTVEDDAKPTRDTASS